MKSTKISVALALAFSIMNLPPGVLADETIQKPIEENMVRSLIQFDHGPYVTLHSKHAKEIMYESELLSSTKASNSKNAPNSNGSQSPISIGFTKSNGKPAFASSALNAQPKDMTRSDSFKVSYNDSIDQKHSITKGDSKMSNAPTNRPPLPPFTLESAKEKVRLAEDGWNSRDAAKVSMAYSLDTNWRNRSEFIKGREEAKKFLERKWNKEHEYRLIKELWAFNDNRIGVRYAYEWKDDSGNWFRTYGNENWEFNSDGLMVNRYAALNDLPIKESERLFHWPLGRRPDNHPSLSDLGL